MNLKELVLKYEKPIYPTEVAASLYEDHDLVISPKDLREFCVINAIPTKVIRESRKKMAARKKLYSQSFKSDKRLNDIIAEIPNKSSFLRLITTIVLAETEDIGVLVRLPESKTIVTFGMDSRQVVTAIIPRPVTPTERLFINSWCHEATGVGSIEKIRELARRNNVRFL